MGIGRAFKNRLPFGKFSDLRVTHVLRRFTQNWGIGGRGLAYMVYFFSSLGYEVLKIYAPARFRNFL